MKTIKVYGTDTCPTCLNLKQELKNHNIEYEYIDILESMYNLKQYLYFRDNSPLFNSHKQSQRLGIPTVLVKTGDKEMLYTEPSIEEIL